MTDQIEQLLENAKACADPEVEPTLESINHRVRELQTENERLREENEVLHTELEKTTQGTLQLASELEEQYQQLFETAAEGIYTTTDTLDEYVMANPAFADLLGYESGEKLCEAVDSIAEDVFVDADRYETCSELLSSMGEIERFEYRVKTVDGEIRWVSDNVTALSDSQEDMSGFRGGVIDITERKEAIDRLREHMSKVTQLHEIATDIADADTEAAIYQRAVDGAAALFPGASVYLAVAEVDHLVPTASSRDESLEQYNPVPVDTGFAGRTYRSDEVLRVDDVTEMRGTAPLDVNVDNSSNSPKTATPGLREDARKDLRALLGVSLDDVGLIQVFATEPDAFDDHDEELLNLLANHVTSALYQIRAETTLRRERDRLDEFASIISHDIRNPLNVANGRVALAEAECDSTNLDPAKTALDRIEAIIEDVLELSRQGKAVGETESIRLEETARDAWNSISRANATLRTESLGHLEADRSRLVEVFENLFRNAIEHSGESVTVTVGRLDDGFYVEDTGPGIPPEARNDIFEQGYTTNSSGTGFGLAIVKRIVEAHQWEIDVTDGADGGARFEITGSGGTPLLITEDNG
ncbi:ATP-binding protein [Halorubrum sp. BV1]|uniref:sensor histidine kinase n=1 Tax=Halorubrum sp. BV1 TaxID=1498500 RepID=UPI000678A19C|nr:ATP-binding protein [Halorubrum sp. BV1]